MFPGRHLRPGTCLWRHYI